VRDLTAAHRARDEAARLRNELAFMGRTALVAEMGAGVAHELNQPLTAILSNAETAARLVRSGRRRDRAELTETLGDVVADTRRAADVIGRMRDMLRRRPMERIPVDVAALLASVARRFRERAVARAVRLTVEVAPGLPRVAGDPVQLEQVVTNLVLNALEALGEARGGGERAIAVRARAAEPGGVDVSVRDSGPGLGDDALAHAFDAFFTTKPGGLGMGLGISRSIVDAHGGRLLARNNAGGGATFEFHLPAAPPLAASRIRRRPA
jgi:two-component system sensor kinase FixL